MSLKAFVRYIFPLFLFFFFVDFEINLLSFSGQEGERMGGAAYDGDGEHTTKQSQEIPLKVSDLFFLALFFSLLCKVTLSKNWTINLRFWSHYSLIIFFIALSFLTISLSEGMSASQKIVCYLYLIKFFQASLVYVLLHMYFHYGGSLRSIFQSLLMTTYIMTFFGLIGGINELLNLEFNMSWIIPERIQYYGVLSILSLIWLVFLFKNIPSVETLGVKKNQLMLLFLITFIVIMLCGKRTIMFAYFVSILFLFFSSITLKNLKKGFAYLFFVLLVSSPFMSDLVKRSLEANEGETLNIAAGLAPRYVELVENSALSDVEVTGVDFSVTERIVKTYQSIEYFKESPITGSGFWASPFKYNYLPDSALFQILVEGGLLGLFFITAFIFIGWRSSKTLNLRNPLLGNIVNFYRVSSIFILVSGLAANTIYTFSLFGLLVLLAGLNRHIKFDLIK